MQPYLVPREAAQMPAPTGFAETKAAMQLTICHSGTLRTSQLSLTHCLIAELNEAVVNEQVYTKVATRAEMNFMMQMRLRERQLANELFSYQSKISYWLLFRRWEPIFLDPFDTPTVPGNSEWHIWVVGGVHQFIRCFMWVDEECGTYVDELQLFHSPCCPSASLDN